MKFIYSPKLIYRQTKLLVSLQNLNLKLYTSDMIAMCCSEKAI